MISQNKTASSAHPVPRPWPTPASTGVGRAEVENLNSNRQACLDLLMREMRGNPGWVGIHAAEALLEHHEIAAVRLVFGCDSMPGIEPFRIGVWRVMAQAAPEAARQNYIERIRAVMLEPAAADRLQSVESLGKLRAGQPSDRAAIRKWLQSTNDAAGALLWWFLALSGAKAQQAVPERRLAELLASPDEIARLRAAVALGRLDRISLKTLERLNQRLQLEPTDSRARLYLNIATLHHTKDKKAAFCLSRLLIPLIQSQSGQIPAACAALGQFGNDDDIQILLPLLQHAEAEARIGAANGLLHLLR